jgi:integrase
METEARSGRRRRRRRRGVAPHRGKFYAQYFCRGCPEHPPGTPPSERRHREGAFATPGPAADLYEKRKTEIRQGQFFPKPPEVYDPSWADCIDEHVKTLGVVDLVSVARYARDWKNAPETKGKTIRQLKRADALTYKQRRLSAGAPGAKRKRVGASPTTVNKELSFARGVVNYFNEELEERNQPPIANVFAQRRRSKRRLYTSAPAGRKRFLGSVDPDEGSRLLRALPDFMGRALVMLAALTGVDRAEQFAWEWDKHIDFVNGLIWTSRRKGDGKVRDHHIPMVRDVVKLLRAIESEQIKRFGRPSKWVFPNATNTGHLDGAEFVRTVFLPALIVAGIDRVTETNETRQVPCRLWKGSDHVVGSRTVTRVHRQIERSLRWKDLRHTFASWATMGGTKLVEVRDLMGHTTTRMTEVYAHCAPSHTRESLERGLSGQLLLPEPLNLDPQ